jgi:hypothetical protein
MDGVSFGIVLFSPCFTFLFTGILFFIFARYLAAKFGITRGFLRICLLCYG